MYFYFFLFIGFTRNVSIRYIYNFPVCSLNWVFLKWNEVSILILQISRQPGESFELYFIGQLHFIRFVIFECEFSFESFEVPLNMSAAIRACETFKQLRVYFQLTRRYRSKNKIQWN